MKNLSWEQVALLAVLLAAIILATAFAPAAVAAITSIASTLVGAFFLNTPSKPLKGDSADEVSS